MVDRALNLECSGVRLPAVVTLPESPCRAAVALLHPSHLSSRDQFLFRHLAMVLPPLGVAVIRYDRRPVGNAEVRLPQQVADLRVALAALARETGPVPTGLWGFSRGAWVSLMTAAGDPAIAFLMLVGCSGVSPARQLQYGAEVQLRRAGYGAATLADLAELRTAWEAYQRGQVHREEAQRLVDRFVAEPWFELSFVPAQLPDPPGWEDMDFDPADLIRRIRCPVLALYGEDEWVPVEDSVDVWRDAYFSREHLTVCHLPRTEHHPTLNSGRTISSISPDYTATVQTWLTDLLAAAKVAEPPWPSSTG